MRTLIATLCLMAVATLAACSLHGPPNSLFDSAGYHVRGDEGLYLQGFPGEAAQIEGGDAASFEVFDQTFAKDRSTVYVDGSPLPGADPAAFVPLDRPGAQ